MNDEVFVAIAAYREPELRLTIESCIDNAARPDLLRFGVCLQYDMDGPPETQPYCLDGLDAHLRLLSHDWTESKGGCWARHRTQSLYDGEAYTLQIDSHTRMAPHWDDDLRSMMHDFPSTKPLISGQLPLYNLIDGQSIPHDEPRDQVRVTIAENWSSEGWIHHPSRLIPTETAVPRPTRILSGMFVFTLGEWNIEVRQDPEHLYSGEEFALSVRSYTCGYDLFNPRHVVAWTRHHPQPNKKFISHHDETEVRRRHGVATKRLRTLLSGDPDRILLPYSVGAVRSVDEYSTWSDLDCATYTIGDEARTGRTPPVEGEQPELTPPRVPASSV